MPTSDVKSSNYGTHLLMQLSDIENGAALDNPAGLCDFLAGLVSRVGMRILDGPRVATESADPQKYGHSAVIILYESHAAVHTYPARSSLFLDLFSCKPFNDEDVITACRETFGSFEVSERLLLSRGTHWNQSADQSLRDWITTRDNVETGNLIDGSFQPARRQVYTE